jgi:uncharacterized membrane protein YhfC
MSVVLNLAVPVCIIVALLRLFKISWPAAFFVILVAAVVATYLFDYVHFVLLKQPRTPDALNALGYFLYGLYVCLLACAADYFLFRIFNSRRAEP